jgi:hypothetical protein
MPAGMPGARRLLVLACSSRKVQQSGSVPAWDLYDGVLYRVCKKTQREGAWPADVRVRILSAAHGLIRPGAPLTWYDRKLDRERAAELAAALLHGPHSLPAALAGCHTLYVAAAGVYRDALLPAVPPGVHVIDGGGMIGVMQSRLKAWLRGA